MNTLITANEAQDLALAANNADNIDVISEATSLTFYINNAIGDKAKLGNYSVTLTLQISGNVYFKVAVRNRVMNMLKRQGFCVNICSEDYMQLIIAWF
jgi:hypothetical protein